MSNSSAEHRNVSTQIEEIAIGLIRQIANGKVPVIRSKTKSGKDENIILRHRSVKRFAVTVKLMDEIHALLELNSVATKRDLYYCDVNFYGNQCRVDRNIDAISRMLQVPRWRLNVSASTKGLIVGNLTYQETNNGVFVDCRDPRRSGFAIPSRIHEIYNLRSQAEFALVVEKDAVFQKLIDCNFLQKFDGNCILATGKGYADHATRLLLHRLNVELRIPVFALVDADPHGFDIFFNYKYGSQSTADNQMLSIPGIELIGVLPSEVNSFKVAADQLIPLTDRDKKLLHNLAGRVHSDSFILNQIEKMLTLGFKMEIQGLYTMGDRYLTEYYLPNKIVRQLGRKRWTF